MPVQHVVCELQGLAGRHGVPNIRAGQARVCVRRYAKSVGVENERGVEGARRDRLHVRESVHPGYAVQAEHRCDRVDGLNVRGRVVSGSEHISVVHHEVRPFVLVGGRPGVVERVLHPRALVLAQLVHYALQRAAGVMQERGLQPHYVRERALGHHL